MVKSATCHHISISQLCTSLRIGLIAVLRAYLDGSGKSDTPGETAIVVAGAIAEPEDWSTLEVKWERVLNEFRVGEFHMKHFAHSTGEYSEDWKDDEPKRRDFLGKLLTVMHDHIRKPVGALLPLEQFHSLHAEAKETWKDPYFACLQSSFGSVTHTAHRLYRPPTLVQIVCDEEPGFQGYAENMHKRYKAHGVNGSLLSSFSFAESDKTPGLQVADLVAYEALHLRRKMLLGDDNLLENLRWPMGNLMDKYFCEFDYFTYRLEQRTLLPMV